MTNPITQSISLRICDTPTEAHEQGFVYREPEVLPMELKQVVVVRGGTQEGGSTVDFLCEDASGQKHVFLITATLLAMIVGAAS